MKTLSIVCYLIGSVLLIISCFVSSLAAIWWLGGIAVLFLIAGCVFQYKTRSVNYRHKGGD